MAQAFGVPARRIYAIVFALGAMLAAAAGVLVVPIQQAHYLMGLDPLLLSFIVVIIGGLGSVKGTLVAAFVVGISDGVVSVFFSPTLAKIVATLLVAAVLVVRPSGLFGEDRRVSDRAVAPRGATARRSHRRSLPRAIRAAAVRPHERRAHPGARRVRARLQRAARLHRPDEPRPRDVLRCRHVRRRPAGLLLRLRRAGRARDRHPVRDRGRSVFGLMALRTSGVSFLIVSLMFAQAFYLASLYFNEVTGGDQGLILSGKLAPLALGGAQIGFHEPALKYNGALLLLRVCLLGTLALRLSPIGRVLIAIRENEERTRLLGYDSFRYKLLSLVVSGALASAAGAGYALLFSYVGSTFASILYLDLSAAVEPARRDRHDPRAAGRHRLHVLPGRRCQRIDLGVPARRRRRAGCADPVVSARHPRNGSRKVAAMAAVTHCSRRRRSPSTLAA